MPYKSEHAARQQVPDKRRFVRFRRRSVGHGISAIFGITKAGKVIVQSFRFDASKWTLKAARAWLRRHGYRSRVEKAVR